MNDPGRSGPDLLSAACASLPLFPLANAVLFPGALLPLHVFEPRYRRMVRDILESHRLLAVVLVTDLVATDDHGHPTLADVAGAGEIIDHTELPGGRYNILLRGRARVRISELPFVPPYRRAAATVLVAPPEPPTRDADLSALLSTATAFASIIRQRDPDLGFRLPRGASPAEVVDLCAHHLILDARERQNALETLELSARIRRVTEVLALQRLALAPSPGDVN